MISEDQTQEAKRAVLFELMRAHAEESQREDDRPECCEVCGSDEGPFRGELVVSQSGDEVAISVGRWLCGSCWLARHGERVCLC